MSIFYQHMSFFFCPCPIEMASIVNNIDNSYDYICANVYDISSYFKINLITRFAVKNS